MYMEDILSEKTVSGLKRMAQRKYRPMFECESAEQAFHLVLDALKEHGKEASPRGKKIKELINTCIVIRNPRNRVVTCKERKFDAPYAFGELAWYLRGANDVKSMEYYSQYQGKFSDDGETLNSAYGYRIFTGKHQQIPFDQWQHVKKLLKEDLSSRQAIIHLHTPNNKKTKDEVCTMSLQFLVRDRKLDMIVTMRSNDIVLGFTYDVFAFTVLQELMAAELCVELGEYYHNVGSMHIYENRFWMLDSHTFSPLPAMQELPFATLDCMAINDLIKSEMDARYVGGNDFACDHYRDDDAYKASVFLNRECESIKELSEFEAMAKAAYLLKAVEKRGLRKEAANIVMNALCEAKFETVMNIVEGAARFKSDGEKIMVEGINGSGKTTFIKQLMENDERFIGWQYKHYVRPSEYYGYMYNYLYDVRSDANTVFDRTFVSEYVYGNTMRDGANINAVEMLALLEAQEKGKVQWIFLDAEDWVIEEKLQEMAQKPMRSDLYEAARSDLVRMNEMYRDIARLFASKGERVCMLRRSKELRLDGEPNFYSVNFGGSDIL